MEESSNISDQRLYKVIVSGKMQLFRLTLVAEQGIPPDNLLIYESCCNPGCTRPRLQQDS